MMYHEINFDGIVGPTHNYAGLSVGNIASSYNAQSVSRPRQAALQGLAKMKFLHDLGVPQAVLPPPLRPSLVALRENGYSGEADSIIKAVAEDDPELLAMCSSASAMWAANAATLSPCCDTKDGKLHLTPANLVSKYHRAIEARSTAALLKQIFPFAVNHPPLSGEGDIADEGAANHMRLCRTHGSKGVEVFVYGRAPDAPFPETFPARQSIAASQAIAARHGLTEEGVVFVQQLPAAIDAGVFHNDVVAVANENVLLIHETAWLNQEAALAEIREKAGFPLHILAITEEQLPLAEAVETYFFNSQIVTLPQGDMALIAPKECEENPVTNALFTKIVAGDNPITAVHYLDVRESMKNGGGPACLRLRAVLSEEELRQVPRSVQFSPKLYAELTQWVTSNYREELAPADLGNPALYHESRRALAELYGLLGLEWVE